MPNTRIPDFTIDEIRLIKAALKERYGQGIEAQEADAKTIFF